MVWKYTDGLRQVTYGSDFEDEAWESDAPRAGCTQGAGGELVCVVEVPVPVVEVLVVVSAVDVPVVVASNRLRSAAERGRAAARRLAAARRRA
jgi:hypothetical protein